MLPENRDDMIEVGVNFAGTRLRAQELLFGQQNGGRHAEEEMLILERSSGGT